MVNPSTLFCIYELFKWFLNLYFYRASLAALVNEISKTIKTVRSNFSPVGLVADLVELWTSNPKVKVPIPTAFKQFFGFPAVWTTPRSNVMRMHEIPEKRGKTYCKLYTKECRLNKNTKNKKTPENGR